MDEPVLRTLVTRVNKLVASCGCLVTGIGPDATGVQGDARSRGPSITVLFPVCLRDKPETVAHISTEIINWHPDVGRVLQDIPTP